MCRRFAYVAVGLWKVPQQGHFVFLIFIKFTIGSVPITTVTWPSHGKFVLGLPDILFVANNTSRYINAMVCACQFLVGWEGFIFAQYLWNTGHHWLVVLSMVTTKCTRTRHPFDMLSRLAFDMLSCLGHKDPTSLWHALSSCLKQGACS